MRFVLPGSPSCKAVYQRNECCNFSEPALSKGSLVAWCPSRGDLPLAVSRILGWPTSLAWRAACPDFASASGWGATIISPFRQEMSDYWSGEELSWDIATKEAMAIHNSLLSCWDKVRNARVDALVDNQAVVHAWNNQGGRSSLLNIVMKKLFATTMELNVYLHLSYIRTNENPADEPSRRLSSMDCQLSEDLWQFIQKEFGGPGGSYIWSHGIGFKCDKRWIG